MEKLLEFANKINGCEYGGPTDEQVAEAKEKGIVIVYGASDDLMEFDGALYDEFDCFEGGTAWFNDEGCISEEEPSDEEKQEAKFITAKWCKGEYAWTYETNIPHCTFSMVEDGEEKYCLGLVLYKKDLIVKKEKSNE